MSRRMRQTRWTIPRRRTNGRQVLKRKYTQMKEQLRKEMFGAGPDQGSMNYHLTTMRRNQEEHSRRTQRKTTMRKSQKVT